MYCIQNITKDLIWVGASDRRLAKFEGLHDVPKGMSYNSYVLLDEKTVLFDTADSAVAGRFYENVAAALDGRDLDYIIVNHMEPDHSATLAEILLRYPNATIVTNKKVVTMMNRFFELDESTIIQEVAEGDVLNTGSHELTFVLAPMVHWPEVMVTYDKTDEILFSADAFGTFGALEGNIFADELEFEKEWLPEARRYYTNIVGKYGSQVVRLFAKLEGLPVSYVCPLHGPIWRENFEWYMDKYTKWATYEPEEPGVVIAFASVYGNTENAVSVLANELAKKGIKNVKVFDLSKTDVSYVLSECFRFSHVVLASTTYNGVIFPKMVELMHDLKEHNLQYRKVAIIENGSWAPTAGKQMRLMLESFKNTLVIEDIVTVASSVKENTREELVNLAKVISEDEAFTAKDDVEIAVCDEKVDITSLFKLSYGLFVLAAKNGDQANACIVNTVIQVTEEPNQVLVAVNKSNFTHDLIVENKELMISTLSTDVPFETFQRFGFQSGRDVDKFEGFEDYAVGENGIPYLNAKHANSYIGGKVVKMNDCGTHTVFLVEVEEARTISRVDSITYAYYHANTKPQPPKKKKSKDKDGKKTKEYVCRVCGYIHEGELPADIICPLCKHGADAFDEIKD